MKRRHFLGLSLAGVAGVSSSQVHAADRPGPLPLRGDHPSVALLTPRTPQSDAEMGYWLSNMIVDHRYSIEEVALTMGLPRARIEAEIARRHIDPSQRRTVSPGAPLRVLPYPGGRHPRIGYIDGAINPQRETKVSVFTPWDVESYVVMDAPEAIFANFELIYLAHTDIATIWEDKGIVLPQQEWNRHADGILTSERTLPNGVRFGMEVRPSPEGVRFYGWLTNGSSKPLERIKFQNCVMLKGAAGFQRQVANLRVDSAPYVATPYEPTMDRWIVTAWDPNGTPWSNPACPCIHSDPFPANCAPGQSVTVRGWLSFYQGREISKEFARIEALRWRDASFEAPRA